jgi:hypothetical protein
MTCRKTESKSGEGAQGTLEDAEDYKAFGAAIEDAAFVSATVRDSPKRLFDFARGHATLDAWPSHIYIVDTCEE